MTPTIRELATADVRAHARLAWRPLPGTLPAELHEGRLPGSVYESPLKRACEACDDVGAIDQVLERHRASCGEPDGYWPNVLACDTDLSIWRELSDDGQAALHAALRSGVAYWDAVTAARALRG